MFGLDNWVAGFSDGTTLLVVALVAVLLGLRHATDPDHLAAVTTLIAGTEERATKAAARLGLSWGLGHATSLFLFGVPIVLFKAYLPKPVEQAAETVVGLLIVGLAIWLLVRWRRGMFRVHAHPHGISRTRRPAQAFGIGLVHGTGGSAGVGVLLIATIPAQAEAVAALVVLALGTAISMALLSSAFGYAITRGPVVRRMLAFAPAMGLATLAFGGWYTLGAVGAVPYLL
jgi:High-affinity nickel-transport protein